LVQVFDTGFLASRQFGVVGDGFVVVHPLYTGRKNRTRTLKKNIFI
jgi:hypothetical protein